jgi:hypothetical protein
VLGTRRGLHNRFRLLVRDMGELGLAFGPVGSSVFFLRSEDHGDERRTLQEYEAYAALCLQHRRVQAYTRRGSEPANPEASPRLRDWADRIHRRNMRLGLDQSAFLRASFRDAAFWYLGFHDAHNNELYSKDDRSEEIGTAIGYHHFHR